MINAKSGFMLSVIKLVASVSRCEYSTFLSRFVKNLRYESIKSSKYIDDKERHVMDMIVIIGGNLMCLNISMQVMQIDHKNETFLTLFQLLCR